MKLTGQSGVSLGMVLRHALGETLLPTNAENGNAPADQSDKSRTYNLVWWGFHRSIFNRPIWFCTVNLHTFQVKELGVGPLSIQRWSKIEKPKEVLVNA